METVEEGVGFVDGDVEVLGTEYAVWFRHLFDNYAFELVLPHEIDIPVAITP